MNPQRIAQVTSALCGTAVLAGWVVAGLAGFGSARIEKPPVPCRSRTAAHHLSSLTPKVADAPQATAMGSIAVASADVATVAELVTKMAADKTVVASADPASIVELALPDPSQVLPPETPPVQVATANTPDPVPNEVKEAPVSTIEIRRRVPGGGHLHRPIPVGALPADAQAGHHQGAGAEESDQGDGQEEAQNTVSKVVTRTFTKLVDQDFTWKDPKAAEKVGMPMMDYVIGGMDRSFKLKLFHTLHAAEQAGLSPGITSAFRDDYRQSIASGLKAAS